MLVQLAACSIDGPGPVLRRIDGSPVIPHGANRILVPYFVNYSGEHGLAEQISLRVRELTSMDGRLAVVAKSDEADLRLTGKVALYHLQSLQYSDGGLPVRKRMRIVVVWTTVSARLRA